MAIDRLQMPIKIVIGRSDIENTCVFQFWSDVHVKKSRTFNVVFIGLGNLQTMSSEAPHVKILRAVEKIDKST